MTLVETLLALVIALGVVGSAIEASRMAISRSAIARLELDAALEADALLSRVGNDIALQPGRIEGAGRDGSHWSIEVAPLEAQALVSQAYQVTADVVISRAGSSGRSTVATLKVARLER